MKVHSGTGPGLLESVYERCLCHELANAGLPFARQVDLPLIYKGVRLDCGYRADIIVGNDGLLEINALKPSFPCMKPSS